jgi:L-asparaginase / beta-aspartyl-peptidase
MRGNSTKKMFNFLSGRVGDSPSVGHGNFADNYSGAVSGTGSGEYFMRAGVARRIARRLEEDNMPPQVSVLS